MSKQFNTTSGDYPDLDRFNRVTTSKWTKDLATDKDFYDVDLAYDRNSNISSAVDNVHAGFDVIYTNDDLNRLVRAEEGTKSGSSITSRTRDQQWTLTQVGNWDVDKVDLTGDGDFIDADEVNDDRTHNDVNELTGRDTDDNGTDDYTLTYDEAGNLTDDGENYTYEWDAFYRLRKIKDRSSTDLVAEYKYNGLGYRISIHEDTDDDADVDASDKWFHHAYDERWRWVATFRDSDSDPKEEYLHHAAGLDGTGTGSYIDLVILRDRDINSGWTSAADGTLEERIYYCQNWRADVSALVTDGGQMLEWVKYSAYGVPWGLPGGDTDSDGDCDATDVSQVYTWEEGTTYDVRGDIDLDGDVDSTDASTISSNYSGITLGRGELSDTGVWNRRGYAGYELDAGIRGRYHVRHRAHEGIQGRWARRDPNHYYLLGVDLIQSAVEVVTNLYGYCGESPITNNDPLGLIPQKGKPRRTCVGCGWARSDIVSEIENNPNKPCVLKVLPSGGRDRKAGQCSEKWPCGGTDEGCSATFEFNVQLLGCPPGSVVTTTLTGDDDETLDTFTIDEVVVGTCGDVETEKFYFLVEHRKMGVLASVIFTIETECHACFPSIVIKP